MSEEQVNELIAAYLEATDAGHPPDRAEFIARHADVAGELETFLANWDGLERWARPLRAAVTLPYSPTVDPPSANSHFKSRFADYELLAEIGRGGMGVVFRARQISLNRTVALKMILAGHLASEEDIQRLHAEAQAAANLNHPGIVPIYEVGLSEGQHYFSMGYVEGPSLASRLHAGPLSARDVALLLKHVCEAVQYAHDHGVVHRDLKPANILLDEGSNLRPRITDFGLAKRLTGDSGITRTGAILGTPSYMSPEQASGSTHRVGTASDIYSLGAILYESLTGRPPFQAENPFATVLQVLDDDPLPPRLLNRNVPSELEAICMKCLEKNPACRYVSASGLQDDLTRYLDGETVQAPAVNVLDRITRAVRKSRHDEQFQGWGWGLLAFGLVIFLSHLVIYLLERTWPDRLLTYFLPRGLMFAGLVVLLCWLRPRAVLPRNSAERLVWVVWIGYVAALGAVNAAQLVLEHEQRESYAIFAVLAGLGFWTMGGHVWGGGYLVGLAFMVAAPALAMYTDIAPLAFGGLWAIALAVFGLHYQYLGRVSKNFRQTQVRCAQATAESRLQR